MAENWIITGNVKFFDLIAHFKENNRVVWKNSFTIRKGDTAYLYLSSPYGEIRYKCIVVNDKVDDELLSANSYAIPEKKSNNYFSKKEKYIELEYVCEFPAGTFTLPKLKEHGLGQVQIQARTDRKLQQYIDSCEKSLNTEDKGGDE